MPSCSVHPITEIWCFYTVVFLFVMIVPSQFNCLEEYITFKSEMIGTFYICWALHIYYNATLMMRLHISSPAFFHQPEGVTGAFAQSHHMDLSIARLHAASPYWNTFLKLKLTYKFCFCVSDLLCCLRCHLCWLKSHVGWNHHTRPSEIIKAHHRTQYLFCFCFTQKRSARLSLHYKYSLK